MGLLLASLVRCAQCQTPTLDQFGYGLRNPGDHRDVSVLLAIFDGFVPFIHDKAYFERFLFDRTNYPSLNGFYWENSCGRFQWRKAAIIGPLSFSMNESFDHYQNDKLYGSNYIYRAMTSGQLDFAAYDANHDGYVEPKELAIFNINNEGGGASREYPPVKPPGSAVAVGTTNASWDRLTMTNNYLNNDFGQDGLANTAHEAAHQLGAEDIYGVLGRADTAWNMTLMGITSIIDSYAKTNQWDSQHIFHLDPWHKMSFGWCEPRLVHIKRGGRYSLPAAQMMDPTGPIILYDETKRVNGVFKDYFILEYRTRTSPRGQGYDADVRSEFAWNGLVIWHFEPSDPKDGNIPSVFTEGYPDPEHSFPDRGYGFARGSSFPWPGDYTVPELRWLDWSATGCRIYVHPFHDGDERIQIDIMRSGDSWVDFAYPGEPLAPERGTFDQPYQRFFRAVDDMSDGIIHIKPGVSSETGRVTRPLKVQAYNGPVTIGRQ